MRAGAWKPTARRPAATAIVLNWYVWTLTIAAAASWFGIRLVLTEPSNLVAVSRIALIELEGVASVPRMHGGVVVEMAVKWPL